MSGPSTSGSQPQSSLTPPSTGSTTGPATAPSPAAGPAQPSTPIPAPGKKPNGRREFFFFVVLVAVSIATAVLWFKSVTALGKELALVSSAPLSVPDDFALRPGPSNFWLDREQKKLTFRGLMGTETKRQLVELAPELNSATEAPTKAYFRSLDQLAYQSLTTASGILSCLLIVGGLSGLLGVQLKSLVDFVGNACYKRSLDIDVWWPWYWTRPVSGFVLGMIVVVIVEGGFFKPGEIATSNSLWWAGLSFIAGYGADDFTQWLRRLPKAIFGEGGKN